MSFYRSEALPLRCLSSSRSKSLPLRPPSKRYRDECRDKENETPGDSRNPPKRGRKRGLHDRHSCGDCAVWVLSGKDVHVKYRHTRQHSMKHPGAKAAEFSSWLSTRDKVISLESDSCMCNACPADCLRRTGEPRWVRDMPIEHKHCFVCCTGALCECRSIQEWGSMDWLEEENIMNWTTYFRVLGDMKEDNCTTGKIHTCRKRYKTIKTVITSRACGVCKQTHSRAWHIGANLSAEVAHIEDIEPSDWVCDDCVRLYLAQSVLRRRL